jgi:NADPH-dependent FMN reductase
MHLDSASLIFFYIGATVSPSQIDQEVIVTEPRKGQAPAVLKRDEFHIEFRRSFFDPSFDAVQTEIAKVEQVAWENYINGNKAPITEKAGPEFAEPDYDLSVEWKSTRDKLIAAEDRQKDPSTKSRVLLICGSARNDGSCPGEISKTFRMIKLAAETLEAGDIEVDLLDLSLLTSAYDRHIYPCKGCVSTAMPLCHWPCSCYPITDSVRLMTGWPRSMKNGWRLMPSSS